MEEKIRVSRRCWENRKREARWLRAERDRLIARVYELEKQLLIKDAKLLQEK